MKIIGLDDKEYTINLSRYARCRPTRCSSLHLQARKLLKHLTGRINIFEEVPLLGTSHPPVIVDFLIPDLNLLIEVQGEQHYEQNSLFHKSNLDFKKGQARDRLKLNWAEINGFILIELPFDETEIEWSNRIKLAFTKS